MVRRGLAALLVLAWWSGASAEGGVPAVPQAGPQHATVIWLPVTWPTWNSVPPYFMPPPLMWWWQAVPRPLAPPPSAGRGEPPPAAAPEALIPATPVAPPPGESRQAVPDALIPPTVVEPAVEASPPGMPTAEADPIVVQALPPLATQEAVEGVMSKTATKPVKAKRKKLIKPLVEPSRAEAKPRRLCWKDNVLAPCP